MEKEKRAFVGLGKASDGAERGVSKGTGRPLPELGGSQWELGGPQRELGWRLKVQNGSWERGIERPRRNKWIFSCGSTRAEVIVLFGSYARKPKTMTRLPNRRGYK